MRKSTPLRNLRRARTMNQADLARLLGVSQQTLSKYENGTVEPPAHMKARLAAVLGVSVHDVFPEPESVAS